MPPQSSSQVGHIIGLFPELLGIGGVQEAGRLTATAMNEIAHRRGWSADFLSLNDSGEQSLEVGQKSVAFRGFARAKLSFVLSAMARARRFANAQPLIVLAAHPNLAVPASWMRRVAPRLKIAVMSHGIEVWQPLPLARRRALLRADIALAPSTDTARRLTGAQGVSGEKVHVLPWPLHPSFLRLAESPAALPLPPGFPQGRVILTVGRWASSERYKGTDDLIRALARLRERIAGLHLVAVGGGDDLPRLRQIAADLDVADRVQFLENLSREQIAACYAHADVFALPSTGEGFGLVFLEAMAFAKPVVGVEAGGTIDVVEDGANGLLVPPHNLEELSQALERLFLDDSLRARLGQNGAGIVRQRYRFEVFEAALDEMLLNCCSESRTA